MRTQKTGPLTGQTITIEQANQYGRTIYRPACDMARLFASIAGTATLTELVLTRLAMAGAAIEVKIKPVTPWAKINS